MTKIQPSGDMPDFKLPTKLPQSTTPAQPLSPQESAYDEQLMKSPFAKMFAKTGAMPTVKEMKAIINNLLKSVVEEIKRQDAEAKAAAEKLRKVIEGKDDD